MPWAFPPPRPLGLLFDDYARPTPDTVPPQTQAPTDEQLLAELLQQSLQGGPPNAMAARIPTMNPRLRPQQNARAFYNLPPAVQQSILQQPSYAEAQMMPPASPGWAAYQSFQPEVMQRFNPDGREEGLFDALTYNRLVAPRVPLPENRTLGPSPGFSGPYGYGAYPMALY